MRQTAAAVVYNDGWDQLVFGRGHRGKHCGVKGLLKAHAKLIVRESGGLARHDLNPTQLGAFQNDLFAQCAAQQSNHGHGQKQLRRALHALRAGEAVRIHANNGDGNSVHADDLANNAG